MLNVRSKQTSTDPHKNMETNERFVKLFSRLPYLQDVQLGQEMVFSIEEHSFIANCVKIEYEDQQDCTQDIMYKLKFIASN